MSDHHRPVQAPPPFPPPVLLTARRVMGTVLTTPLSSASSSDDEAAAILQEPSLERGTSLAGNILLVQDDQNPKTPKKAYLLQRKLKASLHGSVRLGFVLKEPGQHGESGGMWELVPAAAAAAVGTMTALDANNETTYPDAAENQYEMVAIKVEPKASSSSSSSSNTELSALQWIAANDPDGVGHLLGPAVLAADAHHIYTITPYQKEGSLWEYCAEQQQQQQQAAGVIGRRRGAHGGFLTENQARFLFRQLLQALETLQRLELCHRSLSLDNVLLKGTTCSISHLESALRIPTNGGGEGLSSSAEHLLIEPQLPDGTVNPRWVAPELLQQEAFDGCAVDLWSTAVMLFVMLLGDELLFDAPVPQDKKFKEICIRGNLKRLVEQRWNEQQQAAAADETNKQQHQQPTEQPTTTTTMVSEEALDLLQSMLRAEPRDRLKLDQVQSHAWVTAEDSVAPPPSR